MTLRDHIRTELAEGWADAVPQIWRRDFDNITPDFNAPSLSQVQDGEFRPAYPPLHAPHGEQLHLFRAFRNIAPTQARVVVIGQDPYPNPARATGRAFEDWAAHDLGVALSLKRLLQSALAAMEPEVPVDQNNAGWEMIRERVNGHLADQAAMKRYFDGLARQGVLFLNAAWTFTEIEPHPDQKEKKRRLRRAQKAHRDLWRPVMLKLIEGLSARDQPPVFLLMGAYAQSLMNDGGRDPDPIRHPHPTSRRPISYFNGVNPLQCVNQALAPRDEDEIVWWPPLNDCIEDP